MQDALSLSPRVGSGMLAMTPVVVLIAPADRWPIIVEKVMDEKLRKYLESNAQELIEKSGDLRARL